MLPMVTLIMELSQESLKKLILVVGGTGNQGGSVIDALLSTEFRVRTLTRNENSPRALQLKQLGVEVLQGDLNSPESVRKGLEGCYGVFSVQNYWERSTGFSGEIEQGKMLADFAKEAGVSHFVQSTMASAKSVNEIAHFKSKDLIEKHIQKIDLPFTFLGTVYFMDNLLDPTKGGAMTFPTLSGSLKSQTRIHLLAVEDIGKAVARIFLLGNSTIGKKYSIAGDFLTVSEMKESYRKIVKRKPKWYSIPHFMLKIMSREFAEQLDWHNKVNFDFDIRSTPKSLGYTPTTFEQFLTQHTAEL